MSTNHGINIQHLAKLSSLTVSEKEAKELASQLESTLDTISTLDELDTKTTKATSQVTGKVNVFREDKIQPERVFTQKEALSNAPHVHEGYVVVDAVINV